MFSRRRIAILAVVIAVLGTLVTWGIVARPHPKAVASSSSGAGQVPDEDRDAAKGGDPDAGKGGDADAGESGDPDAGEGGETAAIKNALEWYYGQRTVPGRRLPAGALAAARSQAAAIPAADGTATPAVAAAWTPLGPAPIDTSNSVYDGGGVARNGQHNTSGRITSLAVAPDTDQVAYAGGADGGIWKTTDGGSSWSVLSDKFATQAIGAITVNSAAPATVWVGTGEANTSFDSYYGLGLYRSTNGGATWARRGADVFDKASIGRIVLGSGYVLVATTHGLFRSSATGQVWTKVLAPGGASDPYGNFVTDVAVLPGTRGTQVLAAVGWRGGDASNGLYYSTDSGATFAKVAASGFAAQGNIGRISLSVAKKVEYAVVQDAADFNAGLSSIGLNGVYKSTNGPAGPWTVVADSNNLIDSNSQVSSCYGEHPGTQSWYDQFVTVDPTNVNHVVLGLEELFDSSDGGATWHTIGRYSDYCSGGGPTTHPDQHAGVFAVSGGVPTLYVGNDGGMWKQTGPALNNDGWVDLNTNLSLTQPYYVAASAGPNPVIIAGTQDNGTVMGGTGPTWSEIHGGDGGDVAIVPNTPSTMYVEYTNLSMYASTNSGAHWSNVAPPEGGGAQFIAPFMLDPTDPNHLVALGRHVWEDHTGASVSWSNSYDNGSGHTGTALDVQGSTVYEAWCGPCNPTTLTSDSPFARGLASNVGGTWHSLAAAGLPNRYVASVRIDPADVNHIYVAESGFSRRWIPNAGVGHLFESHDGGATFSDISGNLPDAPVNDLVIVRHRLVAATDVGVFLRGASGSWAKYGTGMPVLSVLDLTIVPGTNTVLAATHGRGIWSLAG